MNASAPLGRLYLMPRPRSRVQVAFCDRCFSPVRVAGLGDHPVRCSSCSRWDRWGLRLGVAAAFVAGLGIGVAIPSAWWLQ